MKVASKGFLTVAEAEQIQAAAQATQLPQLPAEGDNERSMDTSVGVSKVAATVNRRAQIIAAKKVNIMMQSKRPMCNWCGEVCGVFWYKKKYSE